MTLYIDPGTGSMLFTILIAVIGSLFYLIRSLKVRLGTLFGGRKAASDERIPLVIFSDHKRYWNVFEPICDELERRGQETVYLTESADDPVLEKHYEHIRSEWIGEGNRAFTRLNFLKARVLLSTTPGLDVYQWKRSRDVSFYVHILHAPGDVTLYRMFGLDRYDAVLLSGKYQIDQVRQLEKRWDLPEKELRIVGITYLDQMKKRLESMPPLPISSDGQKTVLLAPSWGESGILKVYGGEILDALIDTGYRIVVRPHPQSYTADKEMIEDLMKRYPDGCQLQWNRDNDNFEILRQADILISDFSGVMFDFSLVFDKPIIYADTSFDKSPYDCYWLEEEPWTFRVLPKLGVHLTREDLPKLKDVIDHALQNPIYKEARDQARLETWENPGKAAVHTANYLTEKLEELE